MTAGWSLSITCCKKNIQTAQLTKKAHYDNTKFVDDWLSELLNIQLFILLHR